MARAKHFEELTPRGQIRRLRALASEALGQYGLHDARLSFIRQSENTTWRVQHGSRQFLLRIHRPEGLLHPACPSYSRAEIEAELSWLISLRGLLTVQQPQFTLGGELVALVSTAGFDHPRHCTLLSWIPGRDRWGRITPEEAHEVGRLQGRLHRHADSYTLPPGLSRPVWDGERLRNAVLYLHQTLPPESLSEESLGDIDRAMEIVAGAMDDLGTGNYQFGLIHTDLNPSNYVFQGRTPHPIDFGRCGFGHYLFDIAEALWPLEDAGVRRAYFAGYRLERSLSGTDEDVVDKLMLAVYIYILAFFAPGIPDWVWTMWHRAADRLKGRSR